MFDNVHMGDDANLWFPDMNSTKHCCHSNCRIEMEHFLTVKYLFHSERHVPLTGAEAPMQAEAQMPAVLLQVHTYLLTYGEMHIVMMFCLSIMIGCEGICVAPYLSQAELAPHLHSFPKQLFLKQY